MPSSYGSAKCYTYDVVSKLCLLVAYTEHPETASYSWEYVGGCFDGEYASYVRAVIGQEYDFTYFPITVREDSSMYNKIVNVEA